MGDRVRGQELIRTSEYDATGSPVSRTTRLCFARVGITMNCPNCGLANPDGAKFCSNCGTSFGSQAAPHKVEAEYQPPPPFQARAPYQASGAPVTRNTMMRN